MSQVGSGTVGEGPAGLGRVFLEDGFEDSCEMAARPYQTQKRPRTISNLTRTTLNRLRLLKNQPRINLGNCPTTVPRGPMWGIPGPRGDPPGGSQGNPKGVPCGGAPGGLVGTGVVW